MSDLNESGMSVGDFAMSLIDSGQVSKKVSAASVEAAAGPNTLPAADVDISEVSIPVSMVEQVLQDSFGLAPKANKAPQQTTIKSPAKRTINETVREPLLAEQELLQEKITSLNTELVDTVNKLTSLVSEMITAGGAGVTAAGSGGFVNMAGGKNGNSKSPAILRRKRKRAK